MEHSQLQHSTQGFFVFADDSNALGSGKTGLTITVTLAKNSATANSISPTITEVGNGWYWVVPIGSHRDTLGRCLWQFAGTEAIIAGRVEKVVLVNDQLASFGSIAPLDAAGTRAAIGLDTANLDTQLTALGSTLAGVFDDADVSAMVSAILTSIETGLDNGDISVQAIAALTVSNLMANGTFTGLVANALAAKIAAEAVNTKLTTDRAEKLDQAFATPTQVTAAAQSVITHGDGAGDWGATGGGGGGADAEEIAALVLAGLTSVDVTLNGPYAPSTHTLTLFLADDYSQSILRVHSWDVTDQVNALPEEKRTGLTWKFSANRTGHAISATGNVTEIDEVFSIDLELDHTKLEVPAGAWNYKIKLVTSDGEQITIDYGPLVIL